jgi:putative ABC transport system permease protein
MTAILDHFRLALGTLASNPLRSLLTLLGIVIGVSTVVAMMGLIEGLRIKVETDLSDLGVNVFQVQKWPHGFNNRNWHIFEKRKNLTLADTVALRGLPDVKQAGAEAWTGGQKVASHARQTPPNVAIAGGTIEFAENNSLQIAEGRFFTDDDEREDRQVAVLGYDVADNLFPGQNPIGQEILIRNHPFTVVGLFVRQGTALGMVSKDNLLAIPLGPFFTFFGKNRSVNITVMAKDADSVKRAQDEVVAVLRHRRQTPSNDENDFDMFTNEESAEMFNQLSKSISAATAGVCLLSLIVGGIGILNIMLVSVSERTNEIGVRKALGARKRRILTQFAIEAVVLSLMGGAIGVVLGMGVAIGAKEIFEIPTHVPPWAIGLGLGVSTAIGLIFGIYPASRAAQLDPALAMRAT